LTIILYLILFKLFLHDNKIIRLNIQMVAHVILNLIRERFTISLRCSNDRTSQAICVTKLSFSKIHENISDS